MPLLVYNRDNIQADFAFDKIQPRPTWHFQHRRHTIDACRTRARQPQSRTRLLGDDEPLPLVKGTSWFSMNLEGAYPMEKYAEAVLPRLGRGKFDYLEPRRVTLGAGMVGLQEASRYKDPSCPGNPE